jgi:phage terminase large subunit-like protein
MRLKQSVIERINNRDARLKIAAALSKNKPMSEWNVQLLINKNSCKGSLTKIDALSCIALLMGKKETDIFGLLEK